jgi:hypothetical protein
MRHIITLDVQFSVFLCHSLCHLAICESCYAFVFNKCHKYLKMRVPLIVITLNTDTKMHIDTLLKHKIRCRTNVIQTNSQILAA